MLAHLHRFMQREIVDRFVGLVGYKIISKAKCSGGSIWQASQLKVIERMMQPQSHPWNPLDEEKRTRNVF
jgi:hypothetical protein